MEKKEEGIDLAWELKKRAGMFLVKERREKAIEVRDVSKRYKKKQVLSNVTFDVKKGEIFALLGPSGSGKSTLLRILAGMESPSEGSVEIVGMEGKKIHEVIGFVPQSKGVYEELTVWENMVYFGKLYNVKGKEMERRAKNLLKQLFIIGSINEEVRNLSGGMRRRLNICCALVHDPSIVLMDEPTTGLDPVTRMALWRTIRDIQRLGKTVVFTTHMMEEATMLPQRVALIRDGTVEVSGNVQVLVSEMGAPVRIESDPGDPEAVEEVLKKIRGIKDIASRFGQTIVVTEGEPRQTLIDTMKKALREKGERVIKIEYISPDMNDVFFYYTEKRRKER